MATSGRVESGSFNGGRGRFYFQWQFAGQDIGGNYSVINWQWGLNISGGGFWGSNSIKSVNGFINGAQVIGGNTWSSLSGNGDHQLLAGSIAIGHNNDGTKVFGISSTGWSIGDGNFGNSGAWDLPTIPRGMTMTGAPDFTDEGNPSFSYSNPAGAAMDAYLENVGVSANRNIGAAGGGSYTWALTSAERAAILANMANVNSKICRVVVHCNLGGQNFWSWRDVTLTVVNGNPVFTDFTYKDTNSAVAAVTGSDQAIVQGLSTLSAVIPSTKRMIAIKSATPVKYTFNFDGTNTEQAYADSDILKNITTPATSGIKSLAVRAFDSRSNFSQVTKDITVIPYAAPVVSATVARENGFEAQTSLLIAGTFSLVQVGGTPKNTVDASTGVRYRYREKDGTWGDWVNKTAALDGANVTTSETLVSLDIDKEFDFEVEVIDKFGSTVVSLELGKGKPILWIGANRTVAINHKPDGSTEGLYLLPEDQIWDQIYPVGRSYVTTDSVEDPNTLYRGTWTRSGSGPYTWSRTA